MADAVASAEATLLGALEQQWRFWRQYLYARTLELQAEPDERPFELPLDDANHTREPAPQLARRLLDALPTEARASFDRHLETRRREAQARAEVHGAGSEQADPDAVLRALLRELTRAAQGDADGQAEVPYRDSLYLLDVASLAAPLSEEDFRSLATAGRWNRRRLTIGALLVGTIMVGGLLVLHDFQGQALPPSDTRPQPALLVDGTAAEPSSPHTLLAAGASVPWALERLSNNQVALGEQSPGGWIAGSLAPLQICLRPELAEAMHATFDPGAALTLEDADGGQRIYRLLDGDALQPASAADLALSVCGRPQSPALFARLERYEPPPALNLGEAATLPGGEIVLDALEARGPELDPTLPPGSMGIDLLVYTPGDQDLLAYAPALLLADGSSLPASATRRDGELTVLSFLLPAQPAAQPAALQLAPPEGRRWHWLVNIPAVPTRRTLLAQLDATLEEARWLADEPPQVWLDISLHNPTAAALRLLPEDLTATQGERALPMLGVDSAGLEIPPGETIRLSLGAQALDTRLITLAVGPLRWEIDPG
jgi:hypothetical protein